MKETTRTLIRLSLERRSIQDTFALFQASFSEPVTLAQISGVKSGMSREARANSEAPADPAVISYEADACRALLNRQLATGQYCGVPRAAWLARHGDGAAA